MGEKCYFISEASKLVGVEAHVLRYWEEQLELPIKRNEMGHRYYIEEDIRLMQSIKQIMEKGIQLRAVKMILPGLMEHREDILMELTGAVPEPLSVPEKEDGQEVAASQEEAVEFPYEEPSRTEEWMGETIGGDYTGGGSEADYPDGEEVDHMAATEDQESGEDDMEAVRTEVVEELLEGGRELAADRQAVVESSREMRMLQFQEIMSNLIGQALQRNNAELAAATSDHVAERVIKEMDYQMRVRDSQEEERYKKLDETIRSLQKSRAGKRFRRGKH